MTSPGIVRYAILNDIHFPFENRPAYAIALKIMKSLLNLEHIYLNGDIGEFVSISSWPKDPGLKIDFCTEITYINKKFDELTTIFPDVPVTLIEGNHCYRFFRYIRDVAPHMWGLVDCPILLKFEQRPKWKFVLYHPDQLVRCGQSNLYLRHEPLSKSGASHAKQTADGSYFDIAYGHTHTYQSYTHKKFGPKSFVNRAYSLGWLGDKSKSIFDYRGPKDTWINGMTVVECDPNSGVYSLEFIPIMTPRVMFRGEFYDAK